MVRKTKNKKKQKKQKELFDLQFWTGISVLLYKKYTNK